MLKLYINKLINKNFKNLNTYIINTSSIKVILTVLYSGNVLTVKDVKGSNSGNENGGALNTGFFWVFTIAFIDLLSYKVIL